jgi:hypothetical protein
MRSSCEINKDTSTKLEVSVLVAMEIDERRATL